MSSLFPRLAALFASARARFDHGVRETRAPRWLRPFELSFWFIVCGFSLAVLWAYAKPGADFHAYSAWGDAMETGDIFRLPSVVASPLGVPLSVHAAGPGMLLSVGRAWFGWLALHTRADFILIGLTVVATWWTLLRLLAKLTYGNLPVVALVAALGFLGTHLGFYSGVYSSEVVSLFALGVVYYFAVASAEIGWFEALVIGVGSGLAVLIRTQLGMYVALPWLIAAHRVYARHGRSRKTFWLACVALLPCLVLLVECAYLNRWMTGSFLRTPYQFGDAEFKSVDFSRPEFLAVLLHPRHSLLAYHPLYLVGFACAVYLAVTARHWRERAVVCGALLISLLHLYLQAAWFCWWLGTNTFGMRAMAPTALLLLPAIAVVLDRRGRAGQVTWPLVLVSLACTAWSLLHYFRGVTNFNLWPEVWQSQLTTLNIPSVYLPALVAAVLAVGLWLFLRRTPGWGIACLSGAVVSVAIAASLKEGAEHAFHDLGWSEAELLPACAVVLTALTLACILMLARAPQARATHRVTELLVGAFVIALVTTASLQFQRLARNTEAVVREGPKVDEKRFKVTSNVLWDEIEASQQEYLTIPGFEQQKLRFSAYLQRHREEWSWIQHARPRRKRGRAR